ncbi:MAG TPA: zf-HC2 domain-containing protein [Blastocatellia bacterium]|nr:zf-HC2 domain-containing protein [Blastocatellia bacterium]
MLSGKCPEPELLAAYLDHNVTLEEVERLEAHIAECGDCRELIALAVRNEEEAPYPLPPDESGS